MAAVGFWRALFWQGGLWLAGGEADGRPRGAYLLVPDPVCPGKTYGTAFPCRQGLRDAEGLPAPAGSIQKVDLRSGKVTEVYGPSTGASLIGAQIPYWSAVIDAARRCSGALGLGYVGVDLVIDAERGVQVLECNAYPGLEIQNVNGAGLAGRIAAVERERRLRERALRAQQRADFVACVAA